MNNTFEYRLLSYLDGMLDARSESEFLKEVARDPQKQKLLRQYRQLDARLRDRSNPVAVPLRTQQALAQRLPSLKDVVPATPLAASSAGRGASLLSGAARRLVSIALIGGMLAGTVAVVSMLPSNEETARENAAAAAGQYSDSEIGFSDAERSTEAADGGALPQTTPGSSVTIERTAGTNPGSATSHAAFEDEASVTHPAVQDGTTKDVSARGVSARNASAHDGSMPNATVQRSGMTGQNASLDTRAANLSFIPVREVYPLESARSAGDPRYGSFPQTLPELFAGRLQLYLESGAAQFGSGGGGDMRDQLITGVYLAGLRYRFSPAFAAGLELGRSSLARERLEATRTPMATGGEVIVIDRALRSDMHPWLRLHGMYTFNPDARLQLEAHAGSGVLLGGDNAVMLSSGLSLVYFLSTSLQARAGLHGSGAWLAPVSGAPLQVESGSGVIGIIRRADAGRQVFTTSLEFRVGFGILLW